MKRIKYSSILLIICVSFLSFNKNTKTIIKPGYSLHKPIDSITWGILKKEVKERPKIKRSCTHYNTSIGCFWNCRFLLKYSEMDVFTQGRKEGRVSKDDTVISIKYFNGITDKGIEIGKSTIKEVKEKYGSGKWQTGIGSSILWYDRIGFIPYSKDGDSKLLDNPDSLFYNRKVVWIKIK